MTHIVSQHLAEFDCLVRFSVVSRQSFFSNFLCYLSTHYKIIAHVCNIKFVIAYSTAINSN